MNNIKRELLCHELDIVPTHIHRPVGPALEGIDPVVARRMKRKFRKMWRKEALRKTTLSEQKKALLDPPFSLRAVASQREKRAAGLGVKSPTPKQKYSRRLLVHLAVERMVREKFGEG